MWVTNERELYLIVICSGTLSGKYIWMRFLGKWSMLFSICITTTTTPTLQNGGNYNLPPNPKQIDFCVPNIKQIVSAITETALFIITQCQINWWNLMNYFHLINHKGKTNMAVKSENITKLEMSTTFCARH